ncbi:hypothetical protein IFM61392_07883 [Aspergillus lentulus]|uniref:Uncharacterized protein n=1 Tax=Aspergillus lentulus TaxID=293939 RepID=A0ABQ1AHF8_ASPLE|nr:hypothetical protein IFM60648_06196 [Aspergillus lentulus]GFF86322.1 hypothetical protein IFM47457_07118 [Aspergillus lentulus]GFG13342.1 hypothetical protein IFM61392_07883 [Aspergillus lentulus]
MNKTSTELIALKSPMTKHASLVFFLHTAAKIIILLAIVDVLRVLIRQVQVYLDQHAREHNEIHGPQRIWAGSGSLRRARLIDRHYWVVVFRGGWFRE